MNQKPIVLFIQPRLLFSNIMNSPNIGIAYICAVLRHAGFSTFFIDCTSKKISKSRYIKFLKENKISMVCAGGQTAVITQSLKYLEIAKNVNKEILTVGGGPHFTFTDLQSLEDNPFLDIIVRGEAEKTMLELCEKFSSAKQYDSIKGITFRNRSNEIIRNAKRELIISLDTLPYPAWDIFPVNSYHRFGTPMLAIIGSRGCDYKCNHCITWRNYDATFRSRNPDSIVDEMKYVKKNYGVGTFFFHDDQSFAQRESMEKYLDALGHEKNKFNWCIPTQMETMLMYKDLWPDMKRLGLFEIDIGLEAAFESQVAYYNKTAYTKQEIFDFLTIFEKELDVMVSAYMVIGAPEESEESMKATISFLGELGEKYITRGMVALLTPFPGTILYEKLKKKNKIHSFIWNDYDQRRVIMETKVSPKKIKKMQMTGFMGIGSPTYVKRMWENRKNDNHFRRDAAKKLLPLALFGFISGKWKQLKKMNQEYTQ